MIATHPRREATIPTTSVPSLTSTQQRYLANAVLKALRRGPTRATQGSDMRLEIIGANSIPNGPGPIVNATWWLARMDPHDGLDLPETGILISDTTLDEARTACTQREWHDLYRITHHTKIETLYYVSFHHQRGTWFTQRNPLAGYAPGAAATIVELARLAGHVMPKSDGTLWQP